VQLHVHRDIFCQSRAPLLLLVLLLLALLLVLLLLVLLLLLLAAGACWLLTIRATVRSLSETCDDEKNHFHMRLLSFCSDDKT
jgi:hypothetical protein